MVYRRAVRQLDTETLSRLPTSRLLAFHRKLQKLECCSRSSDYSVDDIPPGLIYFKDDPRWLELKGIVSELLRHREHMPAKHATRVCL
jgi:hypothetical protein